MYLNVEKCIAKIIPSEEPLSRFHELYFTWTINVNTVRCSKCRLHGPYIHIQTLNVVITELIKEFHFSFRSISVYTQTYLCKYNLSEDSKY